MNNITKVLCFGIGWTTHSSIIKLIDGNPHYIFPLLICLILTIGVIIKEVHNNEK